MGELDAGFLELPLEAVRSAALQRAGELGCEHAEVRIERIRSQVVSLRDGQLETSVDDIELGVGLRVVRDGSLGFSATVELNSDSAAALAEEAVATAKATAPAVSRAHRARSRAVTRRSDMGGRLRSRPDARGCGGQGGTARGLEWPAAAAPGVDHVTAYVLAVVEDKHYRRLGGTITTQRRVRLHPAVEADRRRCRGRHVRVDAPIAPPVGRGWEYLHGRRAGTGTAELAAIPRSCSPRRCARRRSTPGALRPRDRPDEPVAHDPRVDRPRHRARPGARLRGGLCRHLVRDLRQARHLRSTARSHERDRRPHDSPRPCHGRLRRRGRRRAGRSTSSATASSSATSSTGASRAERGFGRSNGCAFADSPLHTPIQRMANVSLQPAPGRGADDGRAHRRRRRGIYIVGDKSWSIDMQRYNFQFTGQRFFQIGSGKLAGQLERRRLPGDDDRFWGAMEAVGGQLDLPARRRVQLRQGPTRPGRAGQPRLPVGAVPQRQRAQHASGGGTMSRHDGSARPPPRGRRAGTRRLGRQRLCRHRGGAERGRGAVREQHRRRRTGPAATGASLSCRVAETAAGSTVGISSRSGAVDVGRPVRAAEADAAGSSPADDAARSSSRCSGTASGFEDAARDDGARRPRRRARRRSAERSTVPAGGAPARRLRRARDVDDLPRDVDGSAAAPRPADRQGRARRARADGGERSAWAGIGAADLADGRPRRRSSERLRSAARLG